jgi:hypothetical protein
MITPALTEPGAVLAAVKHATRRLRRWPAAMLERDCARRLCNLRPDKETVRFNRTKKRCW